MGSFLRCCASVMLVAASGATVNNIPLVEDGKAVSCIVLAENAGPVEKHAASELSLYLEKATGAKVGIGIIPSKALHNIYLGTAEAKNVPRGAAIDAAVSQLKDDGFVLAADRDGVRIIGKNPVGALYGAYEILKKYADMRWFAPGAAFEYCPKRTAVAVPEQISINNPSFKYRYMRLDYANTNSRILDTWDWMVRNGLTIHVAKNSYNRCFSEDMDKRGAKIHEYSSFSTFLSDDYFGVHPEYYSEIDGKRRPQQMKGMPGQPQPCTSNPKVAEIMAESINRMLDVPPRGGQFVLGNNNDTRWCQCAECAKIDPPDEKQNEYVSTRYYTLVNRIARLVYMAHPDDTLWARAYHWNFQCPPTGITPDPRLIVEYANLYRCNRHSIDDPKCRGNAILRDILQRWLKFENPITILEYYAYQGAPAENIVARDIKYYSQIGLAGCGLVSIPPDGTFLPGREQVRDKWLKVWQSYYVAASLLWNVNADYNALYEDMGSKYYGETWPVMGQYRKLLIQAYEEIPGHLGSNGRCLEKPGVEAKLLQLLAEAEKAAGDDQAAPAKIKREREYLTSIQAEYAKYVSRQKRQKKINIDRRSANIVIDGKFDEEDWKKAPAITGFVATDGKTAADPQTFVKLLYDDDNIYLAIEALEPEPGRMKMGVKQRDGALWEDSGLELFIAAQGVDANYTQTIFNPNGTIYDAIVVPVAAQRADVKFDSGIELKTSILADRWVAEIRVPTAPFGCKINAGDVWNMNVGRSRNLVDGKSQLSSWSDGVFHGAEAFRPVIFGGEGLLEAGDYKDSAKLGK